MKKLTIQRLNFFSKTKVLFLGTVILLSGCISLKNNSTSSGKKLFETFFVGDQGIQYFIKPLVFETENKHSLELDITFRYKDKVQDSATVNASFVNTELIKSLDSIKLSNNSVSFAVKDIQLLFSERKKSNFISRYTVKCPLQDFCHLFESDNWFITVYENEKQTNYYSTKKTAAKIEKLRNNVFILFW